MRAVGYVRVSTDEQASSGLGLEAQRAAIAGAASRLGLELALVHADEGFSGSLAPSARPGLTAAIAELRAGEVLLVAKRDRLGRDLLELALLDRELGARGVRVISAAGEGTESDEPAQILMRRILDAFSEYERNMIVSRTRVALAAKRARGAVSGSVPYGYRVEGEDQLVEDLEEQRVLGRMRALRDAGESYRSICRTLTEEGARPKRSGSWHPESVRSILSTAEGRRKEGL